jgi:hypothetical protein
MNIVMISIFLAVLWIMSMILAFIAGRYSVREEIKEADAKREFHYVVDANAPEVSKADLDALVARVGLVDQQVQELAVKPLASPDSISSTAWRRLEMIEPMSERLTKVEAATADLLLRDESYRDRFTRVERKAGMRV